MSQEVINGNEIAVFVFICVIEGNQGYDFVVDHCLEYQDSVVIVFYSVKHFDVST